MKTFVILFVFFTYITFSHQSLIKLKINQNENHDEEALLMSNAIIDVIHHSFLNDFSTIDITKTINNSQVNLIMSQIAVNLSDKVNFRISDVSSLSDVKIPRFQNIIFINDYKESFTKLFQEILKRKFYFNGYFLFVFVAKHENQYEDMHRMFYDLWQNFIINANVLVYNRTTSHIEMFTFYPFQTGECGKNSPIKINKFEKTAFKNQIIFDGTKLDNLQKCSLKAATFNIPPIMMIKVKENGSYEMSGIEGELLKGNEKIFQD